MNLPSLQAVSGYAAAKSAAAPASAPSGAQLARPQGASPGAAAFEAAHAAAAAVVRGEGLASSYLAGKADPHSVVEALAAAELAVETAVVVRDKVVEAYQELLRMPV
jgi:flagellar hook-basal body complex protein FliE